MAALKADVTIERPSLWWLHEENKAIRVGDFKLVAAKGDVETVMDQRIARDAPDLVVIGSHGRSGWVQATLVSQASNLLKRLPSDVLVVRQTKA